MQLLIMLIYQTDRIMMVLLKIFKREGLRNSITGEVGIFTDHIGFIDTYNPDGRIVRDISTWGARQIVGEGTGFGFIPYGRNPKVPVKK